ncbi:MAG: LytTR family DNA-binding domain-containing protein, partial [Cyclobacteriaceae bacterium]
GIYFLKTNEIVSFGADDGVIFAWDESNKKHLIKETTFKNLEAQLDPNSFFRINRSDIVQRKFITKLERYNKNTVAVYLGTKSRILKTSQSRTADFNDWLGI